MIYGPLNGKMAEFEYDCRNRLVSAGGVSYEYDAETTVFLRRKMEQRPSMLLTATAVRLHVFLQRKRRAIQLIIFTELV